MPGYEGARYNLVWICDSGIRGQSQQPFSSLSAPFQLAAAHPDPVDPPVQADTLADLTNQMTEKVGLVHGLPYVADRQGFAATLEQVRLTGVEVERVGMWGLGQCRLVTWESNRTTDW